MATAVLMIDDDESLSAMLAEYLAPMDFDVTPAATVADGMTRLADGGFDLMILDVMLPDGDGFEVCRNVRSDYDLSILMLTARGDEMDRIVGLELGADDYLPKPFNPRELLARLKAIARRGAMRSAKPDEALRFGRLIIQPQQRMVLLDGEERTLTSHQFDLLSALSENAGRVMSRDSLMNAVRGHDLDVFDRSIDVHISRIRAAIEDNPKSPKRVLTLRGAGYLFVRDQD
ncbi:MAG: DNA-binding response regulator [Gammaproteobacteria bacterium]|nr:DNA-binding response regulator [Gammaproteobacteria bacterium]